MEYNIYGTHRQWLDLFDFLLNSTRSQYIHYMNYPPALVCPLKQYPADFEFLIASFPKRYAKWIHKNCNLEWVKKELSKEINNENKLCN